MDGEHEGCGHDLSITLHTPSNGEPAYCYLCEVAKLRGENGRLLEIIQQHTDYVTAIAEAKRIQRKINMLLAANSWGYAVKP